MIFRKSCQFFGIDSEKVASFLEYWFGLMNKNVSLKKFVTQIRVVTAKFTTFAS